jgi:glycosyltransferase involved in cell wall biosynthesis
MGENKFKVGDDRYGHPVLPLEERKKVILLSDDLRMGSGVATVSKELVLGWCHRFNTVQVGAAIKHPEQGKMLDVSSDLQKETGVDDAFLRILPWDGYGNPDLIRQLINTEKPDVIIHFTDPRYWIWLYDMEHEIRQVCPILFYAIWDDVGSPPDFEMDPLYNRNYYESCDWIGCISKQTYGMVRRLTTLENGMSWNPHKDWQVKYVPHGINSDTYYPKEVPTEFKKSILGDKEYDFVLFWSNRNIRRKQPSDVIYSYKLFCEKIGKEKAERTCLLMHTQPVDENGTNLYEVVKRLNPIGDVVFSDKRLSTNDLNYLYNLSDCTINIAGNEGFGLTTAESVMAGTPIIVNVTGGLQDQCGFSLKDSDVRFNSEDYVKFGTLHDWRLWEDKVQWGEWSFPIWSRVRTIAGSVPTPYIWDDKVDLIDVSETIYKVYELGKTERKRVGLVGRENFLKSYDNPETGLGLSHSNMNEKMIDGIQETIKNWTPKKRWNIFKIN